jgi:hypothetical protein
VLVSGVDDHLDAELARVRPAQQIAVGGVPAFAAGLVQVGPADVDQGERAGQWINGPHLRPQANQALGPVGVSSAAEGGFDLGRLSDGDGGGAPTTRAGSA